MSANGEVHPAEPGEKSFAEVVKQPPSHTSQQQNGEDDQFDETISKDPGVPAELLEQPSEHSDAETNGVAPNITQPPIPEPPGDLTYADAAAESPPPLPEETDDEGAGQEDASAPAVQPPTPIELTGVGLDEAPRSPSRFGHRRGGSKGSIKANGKPKTSASSESSIVSQSDLALVFEKYPDGQGGKLTSVRAPPDYEQNLLQDERERSPNVRTKGELELVSGRQAAAGWERSGIRWAPLNVPLKRRLQTLAVLCHNLSIAMFLSTFLFLAAIPLLWPIILPYLIYVLFSNAGTSGTLRWRSNYLRSMKVWSLFASYFPARLHRTEELPATRKYIFGYHPHGIISHGAFAAFSTEALGFSHLFPGITNTLLTLDSNFRTPLYREYILSMGLASVSRESCENLLSKGGPNGQGMGRGITIVVGGARESLETQPGTLRLVLHRRKGFIKLAIRTGADLVPVLGFGENDIYQQLSKDEHPWLHKGQLLAKKFLGFTLPIFHARGIFNYDVGMMPYRRPINIVVGRPIKVMQQSSPDKEYVEELHGKYIRELRWIWETYKDEFARERIAEMEIVE